MTKQKSTKIYSCFGLIYTFFKKQKGLELVSLINYLIFCLNFEEKYFFVILWTLANMCIVIICLPVCDVITFEINTSFYIKPLTWMTKIQVKNLHIWTTDRAFNMK